jgi:hypothetical protein
MGNGFPVWGSARRHFKCLLKVSPTIQPKIEKKKEKGISDFLCCAFFFNGSNHSNEEGREKNERFIAFLFCLKLK